MSTYQDKRNAFIELLKRFRVVPVDDFEKLMDAFDAYLDAKRNYDQEMSED